MKPDAVSEGRCRLRVVGVRPLYRQAMSWPTAPRRSDTPRPRVDGIRHRTGEACVSSMHPHYGRVYGHLRREPRDGAVYLPWHAGCAVPVATNCALRFGRTSGPRHPHPAGPQWRLHDQSNRHRLDPQLSGRRGVGRPRRRGNHPPGRHGWPARSHAPRR